MHLNFLTVVLLFFIGTWASDAAEPPNILFILADDLGVGEVGVFPSASPHGRIATPNLDRLASQGTRFTNAYAGEAVCAPSRCSLMTGLHTGHATIRGNRDVDGHDFPLNANDTTIAQLLHDHAGYRTALIGKWGLGWNGTTGAPRQKGFDYFYGQLGQTEAHAYYPLQMWENEQQFNLPQNAGANRARCMAPNNTCQYTNTLMTEKAIEFLNNQTGSEQPFFLYLAYTIPHAGAYTTVDEIGEPTPTDAMYGDEPWPEVERDHAGMITGIQDTDIGRIMDLLDQTGMSKNTIVFFASDNGAHNEGGHNYLFFNSSGPFRGFKRSLYEGGIRTPGIVRWPGFVPAGAVSDYAWAFWDFLPTAAQLANVPQSRVPIKLDGVSIVPTLMGKAQAEKPFFYWEFCTNNTWGHAVRAPLGGTNWKGVSFALGQPLQLYDLDDDWGENNNIADEHPDIVQQLEGIAKAQHTDSFWWPEVNCISS